MAVDEIIRRRFHELNDEKDQIFGGSGYATIREDVWQRWSTSVLSLLDSVFGAKSPHYVNFRKIYEEFTWEKSDVSMGVGVFQSARRDYESGYLFNLDARLSGEIFGDFVTLAKRSLDADQKDVAAVLASAALEDCLKKYATMKGLDVDRKSMQDIVGALKAKGLVGGAQKTLLDSMPKVRDYAMHANWAKITPADVGSVIGFVETFLLSHFA